MKLFKPTVGPIVGYTTENEARIWFRGDLESDGDTYRRCFGVVQWNQKDKTDSEKKIKLTKLSPNFDMTGVFPLTELKANTEYEYKAAWFSGEMELEAAESISQFDWDRVDTWTFKTSTAQKTSARSYIVGSCRYLLRVFGFSIFDDRGDKAFRSILAQHQTNPVHGILMVGDQIYADDLKFLAPDKSLESFFKRYRAAFTQEHIQKLMAQIPTYMILDDHEIEDNWPAKADSKDMTTLYPSAIHAYQVYQCSHSPVFSLDSDGWISGTPKHLWYNFSDGCADWFVMDVRTERVWSDDASKRQMIKKHQMDALLAWLSDGSGRAKMIVTSVPFVPDLESDSDDKWGAFLPERTKILNYIFEQKIRKVSFVSGDVHCSFTAQLTCPDDPDFKVFTIISSSFFWPYPHMEEGDFILKGKLASTENRSYVIGSASKPYSEDNFARIDINQDGITVTYFERKGKQLGNAVRLTF